MLLLFSLGGNNKGTHQLQISEMQHTEFFKFKHLNIVFLVLYIKSFLLSFLLIL